MSIYMTVFKCICMHEYMYVCMHVCIVCIYTCVNASMCICNYACMYICMHVYMHVCIYVIFKLGFERYGGNCPSWEGELSGWGLSGGGSVRWGIVQGEMSGPPNDYGSLEMRCKHRQNLKRHPRQVFSSEL